jgi:hypothetical protein
MERAQRIQDEGASGQGSLFGGLEPPAPEGKVREELPEAPVWTQRELLAFERETLGFYLTGHPLNEHQELLKEFATHTTSMLQEIEGRADVVLGGLVVSLRKRKSKKNEPWASFLLEDLEGTCEVLVFPRVYGEVEAQLAEDAVVLITGRAEVEEERIKFIADESHRSRALRERRAEAAVPGSRGLPWADVLSPWTSSGLTAAKCRSRSAHPSPPMTVVIQTDDPGRSGLGRADGGGRRASPDGCPSLSRAIERFQEGARARFDVGSEMVNFPFPRRMTLDDMTGSVSVCRIRREGHPDNRSDLGRHPGGAQADPTGAACETLTTGFASSRRDHAGPSTFRESRATIAASIHGRILRWITTPARLRSTSSRRTSPWASTRAEPATGDDVRLRLPRDA